MKPITEQTIISIMNLDPEIKPEDARRALKILSGIKDDNEPYKILRYPDVAKLLHVSMSAVYYFARKGCFDKVYGGSKDKSLGITRESYQRFIEERTLPPPTLPEKDPCKSIKYQKRKAYEHKINQTRWRCHLKESSTQKERCEAITKVLKETPGLSINLACKAAGVPRTSYQGYQKRIARGLNIYQKRRVLLKELIAKLRPNKQEAIDIRILLNEIRGKKVIASIYLVKDLTLSMGYTIKQTRT